jgi:hypothetical protein
MAYDRRSALSRALYGGTQVLFCSSIILLVDDAWLLTVLRNVVAYACRPSRTDDRYHVPHSGLLCTPQPATNVSVTNVSPAGLPRCFPNASPLHVWRAVRRPNALKLLADPARFELTTSAFGGQRSIQLSYGSGAADHSGGPHLAQRERHLARPALSATVRAEIVKKIGFTADS